MSTSRLAVGAWRRRSLQAVANPRSQLESGRAPSTTGVIAEDDLQRPHSCRVFEGVVRLHDVIQREGVCHQPATDILNLLVRTMRGDLHNVRVIFGQPGIDPDRVCL